LANADRQFRYKVSGGAANLVRVETLVPRESRDQILKLAAKLRRQQRQTSEDARINVDALTATLRRLCAKLPRRYCQRVDVDRVVVTGVNVPFRDSISAGSLARAIKKGDVPRKYVGHITRFLEEESVPNILRFCDRHEITESELAHFVRSHRSEFPVRRPQLEEHLNVVVPSS
jgi:hypothetical protein